MRCKNCGKTIDGDSAFTCCECGADYCEECADSMAICECTENLRRYS